MNLESDGFDDLEGEREFLLKSLDDLDDELVAGNIDPDTYRELHDDYTARASAVIQSIDSGERAKPRNEPRSLKLVTFVGIVVFCVLGAFLLAHAIGPRGAGQTSTGNSQNSPNAQAQSAKDAVAAHPHDYNARITYARELYSNSDYYNAILQYTEAIKIDPTKPEPFAYRGWVTVQVALATSDPQQQVPLGVQASSDLDHAINLDGSYPNAYAFKGVMLLELENKPADAIPVLQHFLAIAPADNSFRQQIQTLLTKALAQTKTP